MWTNSSEQIRKLVMKDKIKPRFFYNFVQVWIIKIKSACLWHSFGWVVQPRPAQEHVEFFPRLASRLFHIKETLDLRTAAGIQEILCRREESRPIWKMSSSKPEALHASMRPTFLSQDTRMRSEKTHMEAYFYIRITFLTLLNKAVTDDRKNVMDTVR